MKKIFLLLTIYWFLLIPAFSETNIKIISDGKDGAKIEIVVFYRLSGTAIEICDEPLPRAGSI